MTRKISLAILVVGFLVASSFVGTAAFTSATVTRSSSVGVSADNSAVIKLDANEDVAGVSDVDGKLNIALGNGKGLNTDAEFDYGDSSSPSTTYAFTMTNSAASSVAFTVNYAEGSSFSDSNSDSNLNFEFYKSNGNPITDSSSTDVVITEEGTGQTFTLSSGTTVYIVITVDTSGLAKDDDLSGDLEITA